MTQDTVDVAQLYRFFLKHVNSCPDCRGYPLCVDGQAYLHAWGHADMQAARDAGVPSVGEDAPEACEECNGYHADTLGRPPMWHEDWRAWLHPDCVGPYMVARLGGDEA